MVIVVCTCFVVSHLEAIVLQEMSNAAGAFKSGTTIDNNGQTSSLTGLFNRGNLDAILSSADLSGGGGGAVCLGGTVGKGGKSSTRGGSQHMKKREWGEQRYQQPVSVLSAEEKKKVARPAHAADVIYSLIITLPVTFFT